LVVEDNLGPRESLRILLKAREYANLHFATNGKDALDRLETLAPAIYLVLLDMRMPVMDGMTFLKRIAELNHEHPIGVVAATGFPSPAGMRAFFAMETDYIRPLGYLAKPYDILELLDVVECSLETVHCLRKGMEKGTMRMSDER